MKILLLALGSAPSRFKLISNHCDNYISPVMDGHEIVTFGYNDGVDIKIEPGDPFQKVIDSLPEGFVPDFCLLWEIEWNLLPPGVENAPFPTVSFVYDWDYDVPLAKACIEAADFVITPSDADREAVIAIGNENTEAFHYVTAMKEFFDPRPKPMEQRKYDVLYTTWIDDFVQPERSQWMFKLSLLADRFRVNIREPIASYTDYINLLRDTKLVLCFHRFGALTGRNFEAGSQGTISIDPGIEVKKHFEAQTEFLPVTVDNAVERITRYLEDREGLQKASERVYDKVTKQYESRKRFIDLLHFIEERFAGRRGVRKFRQRPGIEKTRMRGEIYYYAFFRTAPGDFFIKKGEEFLQLAIDEFEKVASADPSARSLTDLAVARMSFLFRFSKQRVPEEKIAEVRSLLQKAIDAGPDYLSSHYHLGVLLYRTGHLNEAAEIFQKGVQMIREGRANIDPWCLYSREFDQFNMAKGINTALLLLQKGQEDEGREHLAKTYEAAMCYCKAQIENEHGRVFGYFDALSDVHRLYPGSPLSLAPLARMYALFGHRDDAISMYRNAVGAQPLNISLKMEYITLLYFYGMDSDAVREIKDVLKVVKSVLKLNEYASMLKETIDTFRRFDQGSVYAHDRCREVVINGWIEDLYGHLRRDPANSALVYRIADLWNELGRTDKMLSVLDAYLHGPWQEGPGDMADLNNLKYINDYVLKKSGHDAAELGSRIDVLSEKVRAMVME